MTEASAAAIEPVEGLSDETLAAWRTEFEGRQMTSAIWEYCPEEFGQLLDEVQRLRAALKSVK